ncbi:DUF5666 domain-containing protein [Nocardia sp. NPDC057227]|uniref:DUF5666 domain-containing protein n=1 Tax=Nocardia sp. NPDC057227 TaxID=3346056 RepID=UPI00363E1BBF
MTNPKDPWGQRPDESPTQHLGAPGASGAPPTNVFGGSAGGYGEWTPPPPPDATREFPSYDSQWGPYDGQGGTTQQPYQQQPPPGYVQPQQPYQQQPPGYVQPQQQDWVNGHPPPGHQGSGIPPRPPRRNTGLWIGLGLAAVLLIAVLGVFAGLYFTGGDDDSTAAGTTTTATRQPGRTTAPPSANQTTPSFPALPSELPGLPGLEDLGSAMGSITANNGGTLTLRTLDGKTVTVRTDARTQVISLGVSTAADLPVGEMVVVQGDKGADGNILAEIIISTGLSGGGR